MASFTRQNQIDALELGEAFSFANFSAKRYSESLTNSYFSQCNYEEEIVYSTEELKDKIAETRSIEVEQELGIQDLENICVFGNNSLKYRKTRWDEHFQIPSHQMCYNSIQGPHYAYQLQFSYTFQQDSLKQMAESIEMGEVSGIVQGGINFKYSDRKMRLQRYRQKKAKRCFAKKISYACRKTVADQRIRVKGRFVNKKDAQEMLKSDKEPELN